MDNNNIEIQNAQQTIELLKSYAAAKTQEEKDNLLQQIHSVNLGAHILLTQQNYEPIDLATKMEKAVQLDQYRPKNMSIVQLAISDDLEHIGGDFSTFDKKLSRMIKNNEKPEVIRERFKGGTHNVYLLAKQFSADWIRRLNKHKDLVDIARKTGEEYFADAQNVWVDSIEKYPETIQNTSEEKIIATYNKLFEALNKDFCEEYDCEIDAKLVKDWDTADEQLSDPTTNGFQSKVYSISYPQDLPEEEQKKIKEEFLKDYKNHPNTIRKSIVRVNFSRLAYKSKPEDLFYVLISVFAHEMHHALDFLQPRQGVLGPQIERIDDKIYVQHKDDEKAYHASATEISSYEIEHELYNQLKNTRF